MYSLDCAIAEILKSIPLPDKAELLLDSASCGGSSLLRIFCDEQAAEGSFLAQVDAGIVVGGAINVIFEIDLDMNPGHLCGKFYRPTKALCAKYGPKRGGRIFKISDSAHVIQVLQAPVQDSRKRKQWLRLQEMFQADLDRDSGGKIRTHQLFYEKVSGDFSQEDK